MIRTLTVRERRRAPEREGATRAGVERSSRHVGVTDRVLYAAADAPSRTTATVLARSTQRGLP